MQDRRIRYFPRMLHDAVMAAGILPQGTIGAG